MKSLVKKIACSFTSLLFPALCVHCGEDVIEQGEYLCTVCASLLELIDPTHLCPRCFSKKYCCRTHSCLDCKKKSVVFTRSASAFEYQGPAGSIIKKMKYCDMPYLAKGTAAAMVVQICQLGWPLPEVVIPVPLSFTHKMMRGFNQSELLGKEIANMFSCSLIRGLKRKKGGYSQAALCKDQREQMPPDTFEVKEKEKILEKRILLVDDVYTTGSTLYRCTEALCEAYPKEIYVITCCRSFI